MMREFGRLYRLPCISIQHLVTAWFKAQTGLCIRRSQHIKVGIRLEDWQMQWMWGQIPEVHASEATFAQDHVADRLCRSHACRDATDCNCDLTLDVIILDGNKHEYELSAQD